MNEHSLIYMTNLYNEAMDLSTKLLEEIENLKNTNEEHKHLNGKLREENKRLENIIKEAREYLENNTWISIKDILKILKGSDKE